MFVFMKVCLIVFVSLFLFLPSCVARETGSVGVEGGMSEVVSPELPDSVGFADEMVLFSRYDMRERMDREIISFCYMHSTTLLMMKRANRYLPEVEKILGEEGVPDDFKYLMLIESNCNPLSVSAVGAAGLWQFMETTAREYGLEVSATVDERYNTAKATRAACAYLRDARKRLGSWSAAAISYNAGQARIQRQMESQGVGSAFDLYLNSETSRYLFRIMAAKVILANPERYGFSLNTNQLYPPLRYTVVGVDSAIVNLPEWAKSQGVTYAQLRDANPWLRRQELANKSGKKYEIRILKKESIYYRGSATRCFLPHCR